jgi:hypothetical protein
MEPDSDDDLDEAPLGEVPAWVGAELYPAHLDYLKQHEAFQEAVLSFPDETGGHQDVALDQVTDAETPKEGSDRARIRLRNGAIVLASGAVIAAAIAAVRYRRKRK